MQTSRKLQPSLILALRRAPVGSLRCAWLSALAAFIPATVLAQANYATPYTFTTIAGLAGAYGNANGTNSTARFNGPNAVVADTATNVYVADGNNETIRKVTPVGTNWVVTTIAGSASAGSADGTNGAARFNNPESVGVDSAGNVYVGDFNNNTIRKITLVGTNWVMTTIAGRAGTSGSADGTNGAARFNGPNVAVDIATNIYVTDQNNNTIRQVMPVGTNWVVTTIAGLAGTSGSADGTNSAARFNDLQGLAVDGVGNVYVAEFNNHTIRKVTPIGTNWVVTTIAGRAGAPGSEDGPGNVARFSGPAGVAVDRAGNIYVGDILDYTIRKVTPVGRNWLVTTLGGLAGKSGITDGTGSAARFNPGGDVALDSAGNVYVGDIYNNTIRRGYPALMITASPPSFGFNGGQFGFNLTGPGGQTVVIDASSDLSNWSPIWTNTLTFPAPVTFTDPQPASNSARFYRARTP